MGGNGYHADIGGGDKMQAVQDEIEQVQLVVRKSISKALDRGDKLNDLSNKAEDLQVQAGMFKKQARKTRIHFCFQKWKLIALLVFIVMVLGLSLGLWSMNAAQDSDADMPANEDLNADLNSDLNNGIDSASDLGETLGNMQNPAP